MKITARDIIDLLPITTIGHKWGTRKFAWIRDDAARCPLCALAHAVDPRFTSTIFDNSAAAVLTRDGDHFPMVEHGIIVDAADRSAGPYRDAMLAALGIAE